MALDTVVGVYPRGGIEPEIETGWQFRLAVNLKPSTTFYEGLAIAESTATPGQFAPYNSGGTDNEANPTAICPWDCTTDASGNITISSDVAGVTRKTIDAWFGGVFSTARLVKASATALDATAAGKLGKLIKGTLTAGLLRLN